MAEQGGNHESGELTKSALLDCVSRGDLDRLRKFDSEDFAESVLNIWHDYQTSGTDYRLRDRSRDSSNPLVVTWNLMMRRFASLSGTYADPDKQFEILGNAYMALVELLMLIYTHDAALQHTISGLIEAAMNVEQDTNENDDDAYYIAEERRKAVKAGILRGVKKQNFDWGKQIEGQLKEDD